MIGWSVKVLFWNCITDIPFNLTWFIIDTLSLQKIAILLCLSSFILDSTVNCPLIFDLISSKSSCLCNCASVRQRKSYSIKCWSFKMSSMCTSMEQIFSKVIVKEKSEIINFGKNFIWLLFICLYSSFAAAFSLIARIICVPIKKKKRFLDFYSAQCYIHLTLIKIILFMQIKRYNTSI